MLWRTRSLAYHLQSITSKVPISVHHNTRKKVFYERRPSEAWFPSYSLLSTEENAQSVHLEHRHRCHPSEQWLPVSLEITSCRTNRFESTQCLFLQVLIVTDFCSTNSRLQMSTEIKLFWDWSQRKEQAIPLVHFELSIAAETGCSRIPELQEENVWSTNMYEL
jgi:hypothetical protein